MLAGVAFGLVLAASAAELPLVPWPQSVKTTDGECRGAEIRVVRDAGLGPEGYRLSVASDGIEIRSAGAAGELYARQTLAQLKRADGSYPCVEI